MKQIVTNSSLPVKYDDKMDGYLYRSILKMVDADRHEDRVNAAWELTNKLTDYKLVHISEIL